MFISIKIFMLSMKLASGKPEKRVQAVTQLGEIGDKRTSPYLKSALRDREVAVQIAATKAIVQARDHSLCPQLLQVALDAHKDIMLRKSTAMAFLQLHGCFKNNIDRIIVCLLAPDVRSQEDVFDSDGYGHLMRGKMPVLPLSEIDRAKLGQDSDIALHELTSGSEKGKTLAAWILGEIGDRRAIQPLESIVMKKPEEVTGSSIAAKQSVWALGELGSAAINSIKAALRSPTTAARIQALLVLEKHITSRTERESISESILELIASESAHESAHDNLLKNSVVFEALRIMSNMDIKDNRAINCLIIALSNPTLCQKDNSDATDNLAGFLAKLGDEQAVVPLMNLTLNSTCHARGAYLALLTIVKRCIKTLPVEILNAVRKMGTVSVEQGVGGPDPGDYGIHLIELDCSEVKTLASKELRGRTGGI